MSSKWVPAKSWIWNMKMLLWPWEDIHFIRHPIGWNKRTKSLDDDDVCICTAWSVSPICQNWGPISWSTWISASCNSYNIGDSYNIRCSKANESAGDREENHLGWLFYCIWMGKFHLKASGKFGHGAAMLWLCVIFLKLTSWQILAFGLSFSVAYGTSTGLGLRDANIPDDWEYPLRKCEYAFAILYVSEQLFW